VIIAGGFLGAGKTTALVGLAQSLEAMGKRCAVVMNDQGEQLVDTAFCRANELPVAEVTGGCFCCRFDDLVGTTIGLVERSQVEIVLAEAVGSCTDLTATVIRPLRTYFGERFQVAPLTVFVEPVRLRELVRASLAWADEREHTTSTVDSLRSFSPPPPRPTHRLAGS